MKRLFKDITTCFIVLIIAMATYLVGNGYSLYKDVIIETGIDEKIEALRGKDNYATIDEISQDFLNGIVAVEDHRFYEHSGLDFISLGRAVISNLKAGEIVMGGSTITQQLAKNLFFTNEQKLQRKIAELFVVNKLEAEYTKDEILELYVNAIYYGDGHWGIKEATEGYFGKAPNDIDFDEAVLLAGLPQAPDYYALSKNFTGAEERSKVVITAMIRNKYILGNEIDVLDNQQRYRTAE